MYKDNILVSKITILMTLKPSKWVNETLPEAKQTLALAFISFIVTFFNSLAFMSFVFTVYYYSLCKRNFLSFHLAQHHSVTSTTITLDCNNITN